MILACNSLDWRLLADWKMVTLFILCHPSHTKKCVPAPYSYNLISLFFPMSCKAVWEKGGCLGLEGVVEGGGQRKQTEQMLWNGKSDHFTSHLFCLPVYCCKSWSAEEQMFSQTWRRGASVLMGMALPPLTADASTWQLLDFMELLRSH